MLFELFAGTIVHLFKQARHSVANKQCNLPIAVTTRMEYPSAPIRVCPHARE
jgi:hypothetical protein